MSDFTDDFVHFVTVSPPPLDREDQKDPFLSLDQSLSLSQPDFSHQNDFSNIQNGVSSSYDTVQTFSGFGGLQNFQDGLHSGTNSRSQTPANGLPTSHLANGFPGSAHPDSVHDLDSSLVSPNSASSYDRGGLNRFPTDPNHSNNSGFDSSSFLFSNPNPTINSQNLLSPNNFGFNSGGSATQGSTYSHSAYSEVSSHANVPYQDAASHLSPASGPYVESHSEPNDSYFEPLPTQLRASSQMRVAGHLREQLRSPDSFNQEISLGQSISTTNLVQMSSSYDATSAHSPNFSHSPGGNVSGGAYTQNYNDMHHQGFQLTENNLSDYNDLENRVTISIHEAPEVVARQTPSLFSNSSHNSSNTPGPSHQMMSAQPLLQRPESYYPSVPSSPSGASPALSPLEGPGLESQFLNPEDFQNVKRGRQSAHSRKVHSRPNSRPASRSRDPGHHSGTETSDYDSDYDGEKEQSLKAMSTREKMLELANAPVVTKRTQIHPSLYACNLCEKRFTRPYNLKSHLRTHTDERPYICNVCGKAFARQHDKKRHEELHSGEKKFQCKGVLRDGTEFGCSRKFARADALRRHFQTDSGKECIRLLVEEEKASQNQSDNPKSGIQLPDGKFMNSYFSDIPMVSVQSPESGQP